MKSVHNAHRKMIALLLVFALFDLSLQASFAAPALSANAAPQVSGRLSTRGNRAIVVNGNNTESGATILDGATIETPDGTGATIDLGPLGEIDLAPNTVAVINFSDGQIKVTLKRGCAVVKRRDGVNATIETPDGSSTPVDQPDSNNRKRADVCFPVGATTPVVNAGAAANAGAGAGGGSAAASSGAAAGGGAAGGGGISTAAIAAIVAGAIVGVIIIVAATGDDDNLSGTQVSTN
ncbi:MAG: hypothetical protein WCF57_23110, partial [Pyrinomonadaceae bacterium]